MKAENTLQYMMDFWGDLYYSRQKCLNHLFCVIGNGWEWKDGELIPIEWGERFDRWQLRYDIEHAEPCGTVRECGEIHENMVKRLNEIAKRETTLRDKWYNISERYSYICNYPDDIKPDWLAILSECKQLLEKDGVGVPENRGYSYNE